MKVLVINAGSSSMKFTLYSMETETVMAKGVFERLGTVGPNLIFKRADGFKLEQEIPVKDLLIGLRNVPHFETNGGTLTDVLTQAGVCASKREAREFISNGALTLNGDAVKDANMEINADACLAGKYLVVRRGKKKYYVGELV